jgi:putative ABC transport system permease protein
VVGAALPFAIAWGFGAVLPLPVEPALQWAQLALAAMFGLLTALAFALWPLGRAHDIPVSALFRDAVSGRWSLPRKPYLIAAVGVTLALAGLSILLAYDKRIATVFVAASAVTFLMLYLIALLIMRVAAKLPRSKITALRLAVANIHRPGALTPSVVLSLGLGLAVLVIVVLIDGNLRRQFQEALPDRSPAFFFVDIQNNEAQRFDDFVHKAAPGAALERQPMLRGRIVAANGVKAEDLKPTPQAAWALQSDRGITYSNDYQGHRCSRWRSASPTASASRSATSSPSTFSAATSPHGSPICALSTGRASASISSWSIRRMRFAARRIPISRP